MLEEFAALAEDTSLVPSAHTQDRQHTAMCNIISRESHTLVPMGTRHACGAHARTQGKHTCKK